MLPAFPCSFNLNPLPSFISLECRSYVPCVVPSSWEPPSLLPSLLLGLISIFSRSDYDNISPLRSHSSAQSKVIFFFPGRSLSKTNTTAVPGTVCMRRKLSRPRPSSKHFTFTDSCNPCYHPMVTALLVAHSRDGKTEAGRGARSPVKEKLD